MTGTRRSNFGFEQKARLKRSELMPQTSGNRSQDRKRVAGRQDYEVRYEAKKTGT
jgi:hypothetical protein